MFLHPQNSSFNFPRAKGALDQLSLARLYIIGILPAWIIRFGFPFWIFQWIISITSYLRASCRCFRAKISHFSSNLFCNKMVLTTHHSPLTSHQSPVNAYVQMTAGSTSPQSFFLQQIKMVLTTHQSPVKQGWRVGCLCSGRQTAGAAWSAAWSCWRLSGGLARPSSGLARPSGGLELWRRSCGLERRRRTGGAAAAWRRLHGEERRPGAAWGQRGWT
uniref:Uncharacterized protein n=1 Tax=Zea mays TaxID=4577 RepID=A0A804P378_MAIZE